MNLLAKNSDILVAHTAINQQTRGAGSFLHMKPSKIGEIAGRAGVKTLILSHFMNRSADREEQIREQIETDFKGPLEFATDLSCWPL